MENINALLAMGAEAATAILDQRRIARAQRSQALDAHPAPMTMTVATHAAPQATPQAATFRTAGYLLAAGDSWFDYPFHDVLKFLEDHHGYNVQSGAHRGDAIEAMAYQGGQLDKFTRGLEKIVAHGAVPKAILLSGGGNDIAGDEFGMLLNNATGPNPGWNEDVLRGVIEQRIGTAYGKMLAAMRSICQQDLHMTLPVLVHGYDYPVPDGRGFLGGWGPLPGPWLQPGFREKLFQDVDAGTALMRTIIDRFNAMVASLAAQIPDVHYIDLRGTLSTGDDYEDFWANEMHPTERGFSLITERFAAVLMTLP